MEKQVKRALRTAALSVGASAGIYLLYSALLAYLIEQGTLGEERMRLCLWAGAFAAAFAGAALLSSRGESVGTTAACTSVFVTLLFFAGFLLFGRVELPSALTLMLVCALGAAAARMLRPKKKRKKARRSRK